MTNENNAISTLQNEQGWDFLKGQRVEVLRRNQLYRRGTVDETMPDGSGVWIEAEGGFGRQLLWNDEGLIIRLLA